MKKPIIILIIGIIVAITILIVNNDKSLCDNTIQSCVPTR